MPKLIIQSPSQEWSAELVQGTNVLGRSTQCTIPIKEPSLSRQHCEVVLKGDVATVVDKGSMNGTLLNGKRVYEQQLAAGDRITIGGIHIWFEEKGNMPKAQPATASAKAAAPAAAPAGASSGVATRRNPPAPASAPISDSTQQARVAVPNAPLPPEVEVELGDYTYRGSPGLPLGKILIGVVVLAVLGAAGYYGRGLLESGPETVVDQRNVIRHDPGFESNASSWKLVRGKGTKISIAADQGEGGTSCLLLDKSRKAEDFETVLAYQSDVPMGRGGEVSASVSTRFEGYSGWAGIRIEWLQRARGAVIGEEYSDLVADASGWMTISSNFVPPPEAGAFRMGLAAIGRGGRVLFDNIRVTLESGKGSEPARAIGRHEISSTRQGILQIKVGPRRTIVNTLVRLESDADGMVSQAFAAGVEKSFKDDEITVTGRLMDPADVGAEIPFVQRVQKADTGSSVLYTFPGDGLRAIDRVTIALTLPALDTVLGMPEPGDGATEITCASSEGDLLIDYVGEARIRAVKVGGRTRLYQTFPVDGGTDLEFGFRIRPATSRGQSPEQRAKNLLQRQDYAGALKAYGDAVEAAKTGADRRRLEGEVKRLMEGEGRDWMKAVSAQIIWALSGNAEEQTRARQAMNEYLKFWGGGSEYRDKAQALEDRTKKDRESAPSPEAIRPKRVLDRAKAAAAAGQAAMAQAMLNALLEQWPTSEAAKEAQDLLKTVGQ